jgi:hypothetical protein
MEYHCRGRSSLRDPGRVAGGCKDRSKKRGESVCSLGKCRGLRSITYLERLIVSATNKVSVAYIKAPRDLGVRLAREGVAFQPGQFCEIAAEIGCSEGSEVASHLSLAFDYENVSISSESRRNW